MAAFNAMYAPSEWGRLAEALNEAANGKGELIRRIVDEEFYGLGVSGADATHGEPLGAIEFRYPRRNAGYLLRAGRNCAERFQFFSFFCGYRDLYYAKFPVRARDVFVGRSEFGSVRARRSLWRQLTTG
jgi:hypothetical protein